ncbi:MAG: DUF3019 domain-containing protein [Granulosicoccus sp.]|nr:DUF3019 domain-containing protein [Granulosicoccus sp.]
MCSESSNTVAGKWRSGLGSSRWQYFLVLALLGMIPYSISLAQSSQDTSSSDVATEKEYRYSNTVTLKAKPQACVALHKGQRCFIQITLSWNVPNDQEYCLFKDKQGAPFHCTDTGNSQLIVDYSSATSVLYTLRASGQDEELASTTVTTSWVYRTGRRSSSSWRLF